MTSEAGQSVGSCRPFVPPPRLVLFDLDDTLGDYATARARRLRRAFGPHLEAIEVADREGTIARMITASIELSPHGTEHFPTLFEQFGITAPDAASVAAEWYASNRYFDLRLFDDAISTLSALRSVTTPSGARERRRLGIVTNGPPDVQREKVTLLGLTDLVDFVLISGEVGIEKPDPRIYAEALRLGGASVDDAVFIGDAPQFDILGAHNSGMRSIWVNRSGEQWAYGEHRPTCEVKDLTSVVPLLGSVMNGT